MIQTFPKTQRLLNKTDFSYMKAECFRMREDSVLLVYKTSRLKLQSRLGIIVSKKNGNAVRRNKIKRILRDLYRKSNLKRVEGSYDFLLVINIPKEKPMVEFREYLESRFFKLVVKFEKRAKGFGENNG